MAASYPKEMTPAKSAEYYRTRSCFVNQVTSEGVEEDQGGEALARSEWRF